MKKSKDQKQNLIAEFKADLKIRNKSSYTVTLYPHYVRAFERWFVGGDLLDVDEKTLIRYLEHSSTKPASCATFLVSAATMNS